MTTNEAIDLLDNLLGVIEDNHGSDYDKAIHMAIDALKGQQWIPVEQEQPKFPCLITDANKNLPSVTEGIIEIVDKEHGKWFIDSKWHRLDEENLRLGYDLQLVHFGNRIVAWKPLPEPYEGGENE